MTLYSLLVLIFIANLYGCGGHKLNRHFLEKLYILFKVNDFFLKIANYKPKYVK